MTDTMRVFTEVLVTPAPWMRDALCAQSDPDLWFPPKGGEGGAEAKRICQSCDVIGQCLAYALEHNETVGIWGGKSPKERQRIRREGRAA
ncbi:WhiB family transcriptional regulator [Microbacterium sp. XT11]|uniref:WhiB family transcriptional regulator n=1 Tax=Microbacterium sp. XT11 TaxID=367477 RepID=UPI0007430782|nr:WhiB family transcriptional regulator [Microbacterium sp. XT11]ALX66828.1 transcription factor WhiB [Microbacterium sp. XT11]